MYEKVTLGTREQVIIAESLGKVTNAEIHPCDRGNRKYDIGQTLELLGLEEYPELNGEVVEITNFRQSDNDLNGYYIKSRSGRVEQWLNFVWEKRLRPIETPN